MFNKFSVELLLQNKADPYHKLKDNSTMLIEAAKGGHTNVVSVLIDYNPTTLTPAEGGGAPPPEEEGVADEATTTRLPAEGTESKTVTSSSQTPSTTAVTTPLPNKSK